MQSAACGEALSLEQARGKGLLNAGNRDPVGNLPPKARAGSYFIKRYSYQL